MSTVAENAAEDDEWGLEPPNLEADRSNPLFDPIAIALQSVYDPEIPVDIYKLGLIYKVEIDKGNDVRVLMTLTSPGCPVAGEMPGMVEHALSDVPGIGEIEVELVWDPPWTPAMMSDIAKIELNMPF